MWSAVNIGEVPLADRVRERVAPETPVVPVLALPEVDLAEYDALLEDGGDVEKELVA